MKRIAIVILCLASMSLACLQGVAIADELVPTVGATNDQGKAVTDLPALPTQAPTAGAVSDQCAEVIAARSLNLRSRASEHAPVLTWLKRGEVVELIGAGNSDWWLIRSGEVVGFARSIYLHRKACE